jgi:hypothetical protein
MFKIQLAILCALIPMAQAAVHADWRPVTAEELALKRSDIDPNADAEALFHDVWIDQRSTTNYIRFKIFNDRGREKYSDVKIEYWSGFHISDINARTIHRDGTIIDVSKDSVFDKVEVKRGNSKVKVLSFALPSVEPGSIIEYRWTEDNRLASSSYFPLDVQSEYPVDEVTFHLKPAGSDSPYFPVMRLMNFGCHPEQSARDSK